MEVVRIGCRVRRYQYLKQYGNEFTIRAGLPSGAKTELTKIIEGWGDYFFYGFSNEAESMLVKWSLCNLGVFRLWFNRYLVANNGNMPGQYKENTDNSSSFRVFKLNDLPQGFIIANT